MTSSLPQLTVRSVKTFPVEVPLKYALGTSAAKVTKAPLLLVDLQTEEGITGRSYVFCYRVSGMRAVDLLLRDAVALAKGERGGPAEIGPMLARRFALLGVTGAVRMALSALDMALWDALAVAAGLPLARLLGVDPKPVPAYNSSGLGLMSPEAAADEAEQLLQGGFGAVKLRLGYATLEQDLSVLRAVRKRLPDAIKILVDYNQALSLAEAVRRGLALQSEGVAWLEEPIRHDDYAGHAQIARDLALPVQLGENFNGPEAMAEALNREACDCVMPDAARIGGVTGWLEAARIAAAQRMPMSSHLLPEVSAHLLAATPTCHYLEYVGWADAILQEPLTIQQGLAVPAGGPGAGLRWNPDAVKALCLA